MLVLYLINGKNANICGAFKEGTKSEPANYRHISLTCIACKILEHIIHSHIMKYLEQHGILTDSQHGFRTKRSTESQLILPIHDIASAIQCNKSDFSKAFDKVPHQRLLKKLQYYGIHGTILNWFESFLIHSAISNSRLWPQVCDWGVPQVTVLGPLLFLLYINDLPDGLQFPVRLFSDDALLYGIIASDVDCNNLQDDLFKLEQWQSQWQMEFNPQKCKIICISTEKDPPQKTYVS